MKTPKFIVFAIIFNIISPLLIYASQAHIQETCSCLKQKNWNDAILNAKKSGNKILYKIALSQKFSNLNYNNNNDVTFKEITEFLRANPKWPQYESISKIAETLIDDNTDKNLIVNWFNNTNPKTGKGYKYYAIAADKIVQNVKKKNKIIRNGWIYGSFSYPESIDFLKNFSLILTPNDYYKKIEYLILKGDITNATKFLNYVNKNDQNALKLQIAAISNKAETDRLFYRLPLKQRNTNGILFAFLKYKAKNEDFSPKIIKLFSLVKKDNSITQEWWKLGSLYARELLARNRYFEAYNIVKNIPTNSSQDTSDAQWLAGWIALRFLKKATNSIHHFSEMHKVVKRPISVARSAYWLGRANQAIGKYNEANIWYKKAAKYEYTFYGQLAKPEIKDRTLKLPSLAQKQKCKSNLNNNEFLTAAKILSENNLVMLSAQYIIAAIDEAKNLEEIYLIITNYSYPMPYNKSKFHVEPELAYSIIRQESRFDPHAVSSANARGLMQLLPSTACTTAKTLQQPCLIHNLTLDPHYNIQLGSKHFKDLRDSYNGSYILPIAAYNAGTHRVKKWLESNGDPRKYKNKYDVIDWIEKIPFFETRNYVQRVLENIHIYRALVHQKQNKNYRIENILF